MKLIGIILLTNLPFVLFGANVVSVRNGDWSDPCTWSNDCLGAAPDKSDNVTINHDVILDLSLTGGNQIKGSITISSSGTLTDASGGSSFSLRIHNLGEMIIDGNVTVEGDVEIQGSGNLTVKDGAVFTLNGNMDWSGNAGVEVEQGGTINIGGNLDIAGGSTNLTINGTVNVMGDLDIGASSEVTGSGEIVIEGNVTNNGTVFGSSGSSVNCTDCTLPAAPLPVVLSYFEVAPKAYGALLTWETSLEINNDRFEIERSTAGSSWDVIATILGNGTVTKPSHYQYTDNYHSGSTTFYRLKQVDFDGKFEYSPVRTVTPSVDDSELALSYHHGILALEGVPIHLSSLSMSVYTSSGQMLHRSTHATTAGMPVYTDYAPEVNKSLIIVVEGHELRKSFKLHIKS